MEENKLKRQRLSGFNDPSEESKQKHAKSASRGTPTPVKKMIAPQLLIYHLDPGGAGDATIVVTTGGGITMIDGGKSGVTPRLEFVINLFNKLPIIYAVISHFDEDHFQGIRDIVKGQRNRINKLITPVSLESWWRGARVTALGWNKEVLNNHEWEKLIANNFNWGKEKKPDLSYVTALAKDIITNKETEMCKVQMIEIGSNIQLKPLNTNTIDIDSAHDNNASSLSWVLDTGCFKYFTAGDNESPNDLADAYSEMFPHKQCNVMKFSHHGDSKGCSTQLLTALGAEVGIVQGPGGVHGHPRDGVLTGAHKHNMSTFATGDYRETGDKKGMHTIAGSKNRSGDIVLAVYADGSHSVNYYDDKDQPKVRCLGKSHESNAKQHRHHVHEYVRLDPLTDLTGLHNKALLIYRSDNVGKNIWEQKAGEAKEEKKISCDKCGTEVLESHIHSCEYCNYKWCKYCGVPVCEKCPLEEDDDF